MSISCKYEQLDTETRDYLQEVRSRAGRGLPGIYVSTGNSKPIWGLLLGPVIGIGLFFVSMGSSKDAWAIAMLQTAGLLLGGWLVLYAFRRWGASRSSIYGGYYLYFDPLHVYEVQGENVRVIELDSVKGVTAVPQEQGAVVVFDLGHDQTETVTLRNQHQAIFVEEYYAAMAQLEQSEEGNWASGPVAELGAAARYAVENEELPDSREVLQLDVATIPQETMVERRAGLGLGPILLWMIIGGGLYGLLFLANTPLQDEFAFSKAKQDGAPGLRAYLLDERNTRNRDQAKELLAKLYDAPMTKIRTSANAPIRPTSREGILAILEALKTTDVPYVTIKVETIGDPDPARVKSIQESLADSLGQTIGETLIAFAQPPEGVRPHILIRYSDAKDNSPIGVDIEFRLDPEAAEPTVRSSFPIKVNQPNAGGVPLGASSNQLAMELAKELVGEYKSAPVFVANYE